ncbi:MAG: 50S ribosomal protein L4 [Candidatus Diapherotrites archaeon]|nr:50S ribosomal protein L4 [Candidatus Diapherotrites archaeon]
MKASVFSLEGKKLHEIELPKVFETAYHPELIKRAVLSIQSAKKQPKGNFKKAGRQNTAQYRGWRGLPTHERTINVDRARLPRLKNRRGLLYGRVARVPQSVGGVRAHPPKPEKNIFEEINKKEKKQALKSAIAASADRKMVEERHKLDKGIQVPVIVEDGFEELKKAKEVKKVLESLKVWQDVENAKAKRRRKTGKAKRRGRKYKQKKSALIVTKKNASVYKAARNIAGIDVCEVRNLNSELFAPGCSAGRLTVWTESAIKALEAMA